MSSKEDAEKILSEIQASQAVNAGQVKSLQQLVDLDWIVDHDETELVFKANQAIGANDEDCPEWKDFFVSTVCRIVVLDMETPGEIDVQEGDWLGGLWEQYSIGNNSEQRLCTELAQTTSKIEGKLASRISPNRKA